MTAHAHSFMVGLIEAALTPLKGVSVSTDGLQIGDLVRRHSTGALYRITKQSSNSHYGKVTMELIEGDDRRTLSRWRTEVAKEFTLISRGDTARVPT